jgi:erythromycin esterase
VTTRRLATLCLLGALAACGGGTEPASAPRAPVTPPVTPPATTPTGPVVEPDRLLTDAELQLPADAGAPPVDAAWDAWVRTNAVPVRSIVATSDFSDLEFLRPLLAGRRLVQLGESGHGVREFDLAKVRLIRFLHERLGFDVIAFESGLYECHEAGRAAAQAEPLETMRGCIFQVWHTQEVLPLFAYLRQRASTDRPLTLAGFDSQLSGSMRIAARRAELFRDVVAAVDTAYARRVYSLDSSYLAHHAAAGGAQASQYQAWVGANQAMLVAGYDSLARFLERNEAALLRASPSRPDRPLLAKQAARSMVPYVQQTAGTGDIHVRDRAMADNITFLLRELYPDRKVIVWAHNSHIRHNGQATTYGPGNSMGHWVSERHRSEMYSVGLYMYRGSAADNSRRVYPVSPVGANTLEAVLNRPRLRYLFVDMLGRTQGPGTSWMFAPLGLREWGVVGNTYQTPPR